MTVKKLAPWAVLLVLAAGGIYTLDRYFAATVDWPMVVLNAQSAAFTSRQETGNLTGPDVSAALKQTLAAKGIGDRVTLVSTDGGATAAVLVTGLSARSCHGLEHHPELKDHFTRIEVEGGACADNATMRFWFK